MILVIIIMMYTYKNIIIGCPFMVRMDCGTENVGVAALQFAFRARNDGEEGARKSDGSSPANVVCAD